MTNKFPFLRASDVQPAPPKKFWGERPSSSPFWEGNEGPSEAP